jgi:hypothetical protein
MPERRALSGIAARQEQRAGRRFAEARGKKRRLAETIDDSEQHITDLCIGFYRRLDDNIRRLMEAAGPDTDVIFTSDHGFGPTTEIFYVNEWLSRHGYLKWSDAARGDELGQLAAEKLKDHMSMIDWKATQAFSPTPSSNAIFIKKDLGSGLGVKEEDYLPFIMKLQRELLEFRDPADKLWPNLFYGKPAGPNPWKATGLEWQTPSPPPPDNFARTPVVVRGPYDYPAEKAQNEP